MALTCSTGHGHYYLYCSVLFALIGVCRRAAPAPAALMTAATTTLLLTVSQSVSWSKSATSVRAQQAEFARRRIFSLHGSNRSNLQAWPVDVIAESYVSLRPEVRRRICLRRDTRAVLRRAGRQSASSCSQTQQQSSDATTTTTTTTKTASLAVSDAVAAAAPTSCSPDRERRFPISPWI